MISSPMQGIAEQAWPSGRACGSRTARSQPNMVPPLVCPRTHVDMWACSRASEAVTPVAVTAAAAEAAAAVSAAAAASSARGAQSICNCRK